VTPAAPDWQRLSALYDEALALPAGLRAAWLDDLQGDDALLRERLARMLGRSASANATVVARAVLQQALDAEALPAPQPGERLGAWVLVEQLDEGGMGQVWRARRADGQYDAEAAIKLLRTGLGSPELLERFAQERQFLARLQHQNIARLIDGGSTAHRQPFLVMEYVAGQRIDRYLAGRGVDEVLALMDQVGAAVAYAHRQLLVHCDLKPANVLVGPDGRAQLLDFGIAQLQGASAESGAQALTPRYASPEQRAGQPASAASDIFSLGAMLGELMTAASAPRPREWQAIVARACEAEPERRYPSVDALLADLARYRRHEPVQALPRRPGYVLAKGLRRRWPWALAGTGAVAMAAAFTLQLVQQRDRALLAEATAREAAARAREEAQTTQEVSNFLVGLFDAADLRRGGRADLPVSALVAQGRERLDRELVERPALRARLQGVLARVHENLGKPVEALALYEQAIAQERTLGAPDRLRLAKLLGELSVLLSNENRVEPAVKAARESLALRQALLPPDAPALGDAWNELGLALRAADSFDEARDAYQRSVAIRERATGRERLPLASTLHNLALLESRAGHLALAGDLLDRAASIKQEWLPPGHMDRLNTDRQRGMLLNARGRPAEALPMLQDVTEQIRRIAGEDSILFVRNLNEVAYTLIDLGRFDEAVAAYEHSVAIAARVGPGTVAHAIAVNNLAAAQEGRGDPVAGSLYEQSLTMRRKLAAADDPLVKRAELNLGRWLVRQGRDAQGRPLLQSAVDSAARRLPEGHDERANVNLGLAEADVLAGRLDDAARRMAQIAALPSALRTARRAQLLSLQGRLASAQGQPAQALARQREAHSLLQQQLDGQAALKLQVAVELARAEAAAGEIKSLRARWPALRATLARLHPQSPLRLQAAKLAQSSRLDPP